LSIVLAQDGSGAESARPISIIIRSDTPCPRTEQRSKPRPVRAFAEKRRDYDFIHRAIVGRRAVAVPAKADFKGSAMNVTLKPFDFAQAVARAGLNPQGQPLKKVQVPEGAGFQQALTQAMQSVSNSQIQATQMQREVQLDNPNVSIEETMVAMQKAQIGFQATMQVRNKLVQAYSEIMNMQI
jgi:flagellar hook-basal body complex protein FliE